VWDRQAGRPEIKRIADPNEFGIDLPEIILNESLHLALGATPRMLKMTRPTR
jgi:hypothetical protein